jgi:type IV secretory pathway TraG/TraD family ATPase VirD4
MVTLLSISFILLFLLTLAIQRMRVWIMRRPQLALRHLRGRKLQDVEAVRANLPETNNAFRLGSVLLPYRSAYGHLAFVGATGSGKTILQRLLMQSVLPKVSGGLQQRALIYDAKQDMISLLAGMRVGAPVYLLNPLDDRSVAWDIAADITSPAAALQAASLLIPKAASDANPFFSNAARHLLHGVLTALIASAPHNWTLRHVILILRDASLLERVLSATAFTRHLLQYFENVATFQNILSTVLTRLAPYEIIAAMWDQATVRLSLRQWLDSESILVLGNDEENRAAIDTINQLLFKRLSEFILAQPELEPASTRTTWFLLDEVRQAGKLDGLSALMTKGRSKGAAVLLGFQDINGLRDLYGKDVADELVGQCNTKAILRLNSPETAHWASQVVGASEFIETHKTRSHSHNSRDISFHEGSSTGVSFSDGISKRDLILDSEFLDFPETSPENGLTAVVVSPLTGAFRDHLSPEWLSSHLLLPSSSVPNFVPRPESHQCLRPWDEADAIQLGLSPLPVALCG